MTPNENLDAIRKELESANKKLSSIKGSLRDIFWLLIFILIVLLVLLGVV